MKGNSKKWKRCLCKQRNFQSSLGIFCSTKLNKILHWTLLSKLNPLTTLRSKALPRLRHNLVLIVLKGLLSLAVKIARAHNLKGYLILSLVFMNELPQSTLRIMVGASSYSNYWKEGIRFRNTFLESSWCILILSFHQLIYELPPTILPERYSVSSFFSLNNEVSTTFHQLFNRNRLRIVVSLWWFIIFWASGIPF